MQAVDHHDVGLPHVWRFQDAPDWYARRTCRYAPLEKRASARLLCALGVLAFGNEFIVLVVRIILCSFFTCRVTLHAHASVYIANSFAHRIKDLGLK